MRDFDDSTLWRVSAYERLRASTGTSGFVKLARSTVLPTTLNGELQRLGGERREHDALEVAAACMRHHDSALVLLRLQGHVWPLTLFPRQHQYHSPRPFVDALRQGTRDLAVIAVDPPGLMPPGHTDVERAANPAHCHRLEPLLWALAMEVPQAVLLDEITGRAAYRVTADFMPVGLALAGALAPAVQRLRLQIASLDDIARFAGMGHERAIRLLNAIYLQGGLMVLRSHHAARESNAPGAHRPGSGRGPR